MTGMVAAVQAAPAFLDRERTLERVDTWTAKAAARGAQLVVFGESFVPGYPLWTSLLPPIDQHERFVELHRQAMEIGSAATETLASIARRHDVYLSIGVTERSSASLGTLYNTNLVYAPSGSLLLHHRKLVPTWVEKLCWANGDGRGLRVIETPIGRVGTLICGENTNPLARYALLADGEHVHIMTYPPAGVFRRGSPEQGGGHDMARTVEVRAAAHSIEGKVYTIVASTALSEDAIERSCGGDPQLEGLLRSAPAPHSFVMHPSGHVCSERIVGEEGIATADIDLDDIVPLKQLHDVAGGYQRPDVLRLRIDRSAQSATSSLVPDEGPAASYDPHSFPPNEET